MLLRYCTIFSFFISWCLFGFLKHEQMCLRYILALDGSMPKLISTVWYFFQMDHLPFFDGFSILNVIFMGLINPDSCFLTLRDFRFFLLLHRGRYNSCHLNAFEYEHISRHLLLSFWWNGLCLITNLILIYVILNFLQSLIRWYCIWISMIPR